MRERRGTLPDIFPPKHHSRLFVADPPQVNSMRRMAEKNSDFTGFQNKVYRAVSRIPKGEVRSYKWVAAEIGSPLAFRAVGSALNKNPYPGLIPCHRVVRSDGSIGSYSKGAGLKKRMLEDEGLTVRQGAVIIV